MPQLISRKVKEPTNATVGKNLADNLDWTCITNKIISALSLYIIASLAIKVLRRKAT